METETNTFERLIERFHDPAYLSSDPLEYVHQERDVYDQEVVAVVAALLAYGNVRQIRRSYETLRSLLREAGLERPHLWADEALRNPRKLSRALRGWVHRFQTAEDLVLLLSELGRERAHFGSVGRAFFVASKSGPSSLEQVLNSIMMRWEVRLSKRAGSRFFLTAPHAGSACKRWCMLFRWMVRKDALDLGLWQTGSSLLLGMEGLLPRDLVIPLDVHTGRIAQALGLTSRKSLGWKAALEVTESLRKFDRNDPVRFDFALSRLGIVDSCRAHYVSDVCDGCSFNSSCTMKTTIPAANA